MYSFASTHLVLEGGYEVKRFRYKFRSRICIGCELCMVCLDSSAEFFETRMMASREGSRDESRVT
ncbi:hypothetical protein SAMN03159496_06181 [Rhizobium sp. NFR07]|nr:hypothetical protein SAMN03159496_06181 [Rhizobium sp. NFR07]